MIQIRCTNCDKDFSIDKDKCPYCGDPVNITSKFYCGDCEQEININEQFCHNCNKTPKEVIIRSKDGKNIRTSFVTPSDEFNHSVDEKHQEYSPLLVAFLKYLFIAGTFAIFVYFIIFVVVFFTDYQNRSHKDSMDESNKEVFISVAHDYINSVKKVVSSNPELLMCENHVSIRDASVGDYYVSINNNNNNESLFSGIRSNSGYIVIHKKATKGNPIYSYSIYMVDMYDTGLANDTMEEYLNMSTELYNYLSRRNRPDDDSIQECEYFIKK